MEKDLKEINEMKIEKKVYRLRHRHSYEWGNIVSAIKKEFDKEYTTTQIEAIFDKHIARPKVIGNIHREKNREIAQVQSAQAEEIKEIIKKIKTISMAHVEIANKKLLMYADMEDDKKYFDNLPVMISVCRSLLDQANFLGNKLTKIEITQNKLVLNETQIMQIVNDAYKQKERETGKRIHPGTGLLIDLSEKDR